MSETSQTRTFGNRLRRSAVWLTLLPVLLSMWMIFGFSAQPAEQSNATSSRVVDVVIRLFVPDFADLSEARQTELTGHITLIVRKMAHALEYAMLGFFLHLHVWAWHRRFRPAEGDPAIRRRPLWWLWSLPIGCLYAITDELHQGFVADRAPRIADVGIDTVGVIAGMTACALMLWLIRLVKKKRTRQRDA